MREWILPAAGWRRAALYQWRRLQRLNATPHSVALGFAIGVFMSFSPFLGLHLVLSGLFAWLLRGNILAAMLGNFLGNPVTYPVMWAGIYATGNFLLGAPTDKVASDFSFAALLSETRDFFLPFLTGSVVVGLIAALLFYFPVKSGVARYQSARQSRFLRDQPAAEADGSSQQTYEAK